MITRPCAGAAKVIANGTVGSSQWRCSPTSTSRMPSRRSIRRNITWSGLTPGSTDGSVRPRSIPCQAASGLSARRVNERQTASIRDRIAASRSSASSSKRAVRRAHSVAVGSAILRSARSNALADVPSTSPIGNTSHSNAPQAAGRPGAASALPTLASTWRCISCRNTSVGLARAASIPVSSGPSSVNRWDHPPAGNDRAAWSIASSGVSNSGRPATSSSTRRRKPRARERPPSAPNNQRRSSAASSPDNTAENAESAASKRWCPSSNT